MAGYVTRRLFAAMALIAFAATISLTGIVRASTPTSNWCATPRSGASMGGGMMSGGMMTGSPVTGMHMQQEFDLMFIDMMIPHHQSAIVMAEIALERGEHQEILDLAQVIIDSRQAEIDQMMAWRDAWYPDAPSIPMDQMGSMMMGMLGQMPGMMGTPSAGMGHMGSINDMMGMMAPESQGRALCDASSSFDEAFPRMMIPHHQSAVVMAQVALLQATHAEIKELAQAIIDAQGREIAMMQGWLDAWFNAAPAATPVAPEGAVRVDVVLSEFAFTSSLTEFEVGVSYAFVVTNSGALPHEFMIIPPMSGMGQMDMETLDAMAVAVIPAGDLPAGATKMIEVVFTEPAAEGELELSCTITGHYEAGMHLPITVLQ